MKIKLYNTPSRKKEIFRPLRKDWVGLYTCGPTVYNFVHIGNLRTYIFQDVLKRVLKEAGYKVRHLMNTTDVDDKTIKGAKAAGKLLKEFTRHYEKIFLEDLEKLNIKPPDILSRATEHIPEMVALIKTLMAKGFAYKKEGSVYFDISKFKNYGKLARLNLKGLKAGARVDADEYAKDEVQDFVLWKGQRPGEPHWKASFGEGRPGWHIECSAMSMRYLGKTFDLHTGGVDLIFPHHQNEVAQSEGGTGKKFVRYWLHGEHLLVEGKKMAKSSHNFFTLRDIENKNFNPLSYRYLVLTSHYRSKLNFTWDSLQAAQNSLDKLYDFAGRIMSERQERQKISIEPFKKRFNEALANDLDTSRALAVVWALIHKYNKNPRQFDAKAVLDLLFDFDKVLGLGLKTRKPAAIPQKVLALVKKREEYRKNKQWQEADDLRARIKSLGYSIEDTTRGQKIKKQ